MEDNKIITETVVDNAAENAELTQPTETAEEAIARLMAENKRLKKASDKNASDASSWKKKYMDTQTEADKLSMEKAERDAELREELEALRKESKVNKFAKSFLAMGYSEEQATKAAEAQYSGDTDELFRIQKQYQEEYAKKIRAEIMKTMPAPATGNDDGLHITQEQFDNMSYREQLDLFENHPSVYEKLTKR